MAKIKMSVIGGEYDSHIILPSAKKAHSNVLLYLDIRVHLVRLDVTEITNEKKKIKCRPWTDAEWLEFGKNVESIAEKHFKDIYWLVPPDSYSGLDQPLAKPRYRPRVKCRLNVILSKNAKSRRHIRIKAVRLAKDNADIRSHSRLYDHNDIKKDGDQIVVVHEMGHAIGLPHPGIRNKVAACLKDGNRTECYKPRGELMGAGMKMITAYGAPWKKRLTRHIGTKTTGWKISMRPQNPEPLSIKGIRDRAGVRMRRRILDSVNDL